MRQRRFQILLGAAVAVTLLGAEPVRGQEQPFEIVAPAPPVKPPVPPPEIITPGPSPEVTRPREADVRQDDPDEVRVQHDPAFITPLTTTVQTGADSAVRFGVSGWTSPPGPRGLVGHENPGWFALGLSIVWDVPREPDSEGSSKTPR
ncbi:MAG: hypothetical protein ACE5FK_08480 [Candidatus Methylomirabilia bacterium]